MVIKFNADLLKIKFFKSFLLVLTKFAFWQEDWALGYYSMKF